MPRIKYYSEELGRWEYADSSLGLTGEPGGHYTPVITQPTDNTVQVLFTPSKVGMPAVAPVTVNLPVGEGYGQNVELDTTLTQNGKAADAKATGDALDELEEKIPTKPEDIGAQPKGNYLTSAPVTAVNGKTGAVQLSAEDVGARPNTWTPTAQEVGALPDTYTPPNQTAEQVGADPKGTAAAAVAEHNTATDAHNDIRVKLEELRQTLAHFFNATTPETMDQISELVSGIESNADLIAALTTGKVSVSSIVANLTTNLADRPLAASMGVELKKLIDQVSASLANYQPKGNYALASAVPTKTSQLQNDSEYLTAVTAAMITAALGYIPINPGLATLARHEDGLLYLFVDGKPVGSGVELPTGGIDGYVDADKNIVVRGLDEGVTYNFYFEMADGSLVEGGELVYDNTVYYTVTNTLTNCTISNSATQVIEGESYSATITAKSGYELKSVVVTMGGSPVTVSGGTISIASVTGNIEITAVAEEVQTGPTNLANPNDTYWKEGYRLSISSGGTSTLSGHTVTNFIPAKAGDVLRVKGMKLTSNGGGTSNDCKIVLYSAKDNESSKVAGAFGSGTGDTYTSKVTVNGDVSSLTVLTLENGTQLATSAVKYLRIDGTLLSGYTKNDVIITINEPIE